MTEFDDGFVLFTDTTRGRAFAKDPAVIEFAGRFLLYYSLSPYFDGRDSDGWRIGIATSDDLAQWARIGEIGPATEYESVGICAAGACVIKDEVHLFYQTYGYGNRDAICHGVSNDGLSFLRDSTNPIFAPTGEWNNGRAIDADVVVVNEIMYLYAATRDPRGMTQILCGAKAHASGSFSRNDWTPLSNDALMVPELPWEQDCVEAPSVLYREGKFHMFYAGAYNNAPQQIGHAISDDGVIWTHTSQEPIIPNGGRDSWNSSESGHCYAFETRGRTFVFFQGNNDKGKSWFISSVEVEWNEDRPIVKPFLGL